ncbi:MAG: hypothetical protein WAX07_04795 [Candidatus Altiarchaeia archaeon]|jgi:Flp pilus assembly pilin Flp
MKQHPIKEFLRDQRGETSMVIQLLLAVAIAAAVIVILLQLMHVNLDISRNTTPKITNATKSALENGMQELSD